VRSALRRHLATVAILCAAGGFYAWTAATSAPFQFKSHQGDVYNLLTTAFLHGHTYLPVTVPPGLLHLHNPYDPAQNAPYQGSYHDLSLRNGHFYAPYGPAPVLLFALLRLTTLELPDSFAAFLFSWLGLLAATALLHSLLSRLIESRPRWLMPVATAGLALSNVVPFILRRPAFYEVAIGSGYCFAMAGLWLTFTAVTADDRRRLALGSLCLGLAVGSRPTWLVAGAVAIAGAFVYLKPRGRELTRFLAAAAAPFAVCCVLLAAYNTARFGSPGEFGQRYQLAAVNVLDKPADQLSYVAPGVWSYLFERPRLKLTFPHVFIKALSAEDYPGTLPAGYAGTAGGGPVEPAGGLFPMLPLTLLLLGLPLLWRRRRSGDGSAIVVATGFAAAGLLTVIGLSWALWGTTERYEVDYATDFMIGAFLVWAILLARSDRARLPARLLITVGGAALTAIGAAAGLAISFTGYYDALQARHPGTFHLLEDVTAPLASLATMLKGNPVLVRVAPVGYPGVGLGMAGASTTLGSGTVTFTIDSPGGDHTALRATTTLPPGRTAPAVVRSPGGRPALVVLRAGHVRLPIDLHWGLNRITLRLAGRASQPVGLGDIVLSR
jgi:hypothetical protein